MAPGGYSFYMDARSFWVRRLKSGQVPKPEPAYVPVEEDYNMNAPENAFREFYGRHRCPACRKPYFFLESALDCHPEASAYKVWEKFAHSGPVGSASPAEAIQTAIYSSCGGFYGSGPFGPL